MNINLENKKAFVCGSTQGIGKAIAIELAKLGAEVVLISRDEEKLKKTLSELDSSKGQKHRYIQADFSHPEKLKEKTAHWIKEHGTKPVVGFIAGQTAPPGRRMGHAGAIVGGADDTAAAKMKIMAECGIRVVESPAEIGAAMAEELAKLVV